MKRPNTNLLTEQIYDILWVEIVQRNLKPNEKLDINQLAQQMGVSRTPIMDALARLENDGLVLRRNRVGTFVTPFSKAAFLNSFMSRDMVEQYITPIIITNLTSQDIEELESLLENFDDLITNANDDSFDYGTYTRYDYDFHSKLVQLCRNDQIIEFYRSLNSHMQIARAYSKHALKRATEGLEEHHQILQALVQGEVEKARLLQHTHLTRSRDGILTILDEHDFL